MGLMWVEEGENRGLIWKEKKYGFNVEERENYGFNVEEAEDYGFNVDGRRAWGGVGM